MGYRAFFSYARADDRTANWLHRQLDSYRTPRALVGSEGAFGPIPAKLHPIFRDRTDLKAGGHIDASLQQALEESEALVVLCTPISAKSHWVNHECETFLKLGREAHIFPVIAGGEPDSGDPETECFPPALRGKGIFAADLREVKLPSGQLIGDGREGGRLKLVAGLLGVGLDALARRERRRQRALIASLGVAALTFAGVAAAAVWLGVLANDNAHRAQAQADRSLSLLLAGQSRQVIGQNDERALLLAVEAVRATDSENIVTTEARQALEEALGHVTGAGVSGHSDGVELAAFSDDDRLLATGSQSPARGGGGEVRVWDISNPQRPTIRHILGLPSGPTAAVFDHSGSHVLTLAGQALVWDLRPGQRYPRSRPFLSGGGAAAFAVSRRASLVALAEESSAFVAIFSSRDLARTDAVRALMVPLDEDIVKLTFSSDGTVLLAGTQQSHVLVWNLVDSSPDPVARFDANHVRVFPWRERERVNILGISDDHSFLYTASSDIFNESTSADLNLKIWRLQALRPIGQPISLLHQSEPNSSAIQSATLSSDNAFLLSLSMDGVVRAWPIRDALAGHAQPIILHRAGWTSAGDLSADGQLFALPADREVQVVDVTNPVAGGARARVTHLTGFDGSPRFVSFSPTRRLLIAGGGAGRVRLWDLSQPNVIGGPGTPPAPSDDAWLDDRGTLAATLNNLVVRFWDIRNPSRPQVIRSESVTQDAIDARRGDGPACLACVARVSADAHWAAILQRRDEYKLVELAPNGRSFMIESGGEPEFDPSGRWLLVRSRDGDESVFDLHAASPGEGRVVSAASGRDYVQREFSPFGPLVLYHWNAQGAATPTGSLVDLRTGVPLTITGFERGIGSVAFAHNGHWLALGGDRGIGRAAEDDTIIELWPVRAGPARPIVLRGQEHAPRLLFSGDDRWLYSDSTDMLLGGQRTLPRLWRVGSSQPDAQILPGPTTYTHAAQMSPDGRFLVTINGGGPTGRLWRLNDEGPQLVTTLSVPAQTYNWHWGIDFSPDSSVVVIHNYDNPIPYLWRLNAQTITARGEAIANGDRAIQSVRFSPGGKTILILNAGGTATGMSGTAGSHVTVVNLDAFPAEGSTFALLYSAADARQVTYRADRRLVLTAGPTLRAGQLQIADLLRRAETAAGRNLSLDEWQKAGIPHAFRPTFPNQPVDANTLSDLPNVVAQLRTRDANEARRLAREMVRWASARGEARLCNHVAWQLDLQRDGANALAAAQCAVSLRPDEANYRDTRGVALALEGRRADAIADFESFIESQRNNPANAEDVARRREWIRALTAGDDPFRNGIE